jgi:hypothetical protein
MGHDGPSRGIGSTDPSRGCGRRVEVRLRITAVDGPVPGSIVSAIAMSDPTVRRSVNFTCYLTQHGPIL